MGTYAFVTASTDDSVSIIKVSDTANPSLASTIRGAGAPNYLDSPKGICVVGDYAYVCACRSTDDYFVIIDISNPTAPVFKGEIHGAGTPNYLDQAQNVYVSGDYAYITSYADNALTIIDISDPTAPTLKSSIQGAGASNYLGGAWNLHISGNYAYIAAYDDSALTIIDITDPANPAFEGSIQGSGSEPWLGGANDVFVSGNYAYVACYDDDALTVIDVSDTTAPAFEGVIKGGGAEPWLSEAHNIVVSGNYAYITARGDDALVIIDISTSSSPAFEGVIKGAGAEPWLNAATGLTVSGNYAYVTAWYDDALVIIDISDTTAPTFESVISGAGTPNYLDHPFSVTLATITFTTTVTTQTMQDVVGTTATGRGNITELGDPNPTAHGHCWKITANPTTSDGVVDNGAASATGTFTSALTGLTPGTGYYTRAYATNEVGTSYGANVYFIAPTTEVGGRAGYIWMEGSNLHGFDAVAVEQIYLHQRDVDDTPVDAATADPISSNWAYDHEAAADPHTGYQKETDFTAGSVLFRGSSVITEDNSNLFWDDTNKVLGIGTNSPAPSAKLHTEGDIFLINSGGDPRIVLGDSTAAGNWGGIRWNSSSDYIGIGTSGANIDAIVIKEDGDVGIGTVSPSSKLEVTGEVTITGADATFNDNYGTVFGTGYDTAIYYNNTNLVIDPDAAGSGIVLIGVTGDDDLEAYNITATGNISVSGTVDGVDVSAHATTKAANATLGHVIVETGSSIDVDGNGKIVLGDISGFLESSPTDNESGKAPDSNWAYDHTADADAHGDAVITADTNSATADDLNFSIVGGEGIDTSGATTVITITGEAASTTNKGVVELAIGSEVNTGTSVVLAVTPDALDDWTGSAQITTVGTLAAHTSAGITFNTGEAVFRNVDNSYLRIMGGADYNSAGMYLCGKTHATPGQLDLFTTSQTQGIRTRLTISGNLATAVASWANITHTGLVLSGGINCGSQAITNADINSGTLAGVTVDGDLTWSSAQTGVSEFTFSAFPITPSAAPDANYEVANKKYVDDNSGAPTMEFFDTPHLATDMQPYGGLIDGGVDDARIMILVPQDFGTLSDIEVIFLTNETGASMHFNIVTEYGVYDGGEAHSVHGGSDVARDIGATTADENLAHDISDLAADLAAGDILYVSVGYNATAVDSNAYVRGVRLKYT